MPSVEAEPRLWWLGGDDSDALLHALDHGTPGIATGGPARLGIVDPDDRKVELARRLVAKGKPWRGRSDIWFTPDGLAGQGGKVAFLFPGVEPTFGAEATDVPALAARLGLEAPPLDETTLAHRSASIYRLGIFLDLVLRALGVEPDVVAGHSIGEWSGSVAAGMVPRERAEDVLTVLDLDAVELPELDFAALGAGATAVSVALAGIDGIDISHDNCPGQSVICGPSGIVDHALAQLREANILGYKLDFRSGFHTPAIAPALDVFRAHGDSLPVGPPEIPMWSATSVTPYPRTREEIIELHLRHLVEPVRFRPLVERLYDDAGARVFVQVGLGSLTSFVDDTLGDRDHACVQLLTANRSALAQVHRALTALWVEGVQPRLDRLAAPRPSTHQLVRAPALLGAAEMLSGAARASQQVIDALTGRLSASDSAAPARRPGGKITVERRLSLETMPETLDHTLYQQPEGWDDPADLFPIVAMTTQIELLQDLATEYADGREVVEVFGVRNLRWLDISSPLDVPITVDPKDDDVLQLTLGGYCRANVRLGWYPAPVRYEPRPLANPRPTVHTAQEMFDLRLMFHGPRFQGINHMGPIGDDGILGELHNLSTPGSLLDNMGKLVAYWVMDHRSWQEGPLPIGLDRVELFGPKPPPGVDLCCDVRIVDLQEDLVRANGQIVAPDGTVWCRVEGWASHVFHLDDKTEQLYRAPSYSFITEPQPGGWNLVRERWPSGAARDFSARRYLSRREREEYESLNLLEQRHWLIKMAIGKDVVRQWLWNGLGTPSYPVEVTLVPDGEHRFRVVSDRIPAGHDLCITFSSLDWLAVAVLGDGEPRDIEAREVPEGADPDAVAHQVAETLGARNPGAQVDHIVPVDIETASGRPVAVAWTAPQRSGVSQRLIRP
jgi:malonyl CoA-acyl carrier protein transacylase